MGDHVGILSVVLFTLCQDHCSKPSYASFLAHTTTYTTTQYYYCHLSHIYKKKVPIYIVLCPLITSTISGTISNSNEMGNFIFIDGWVQSNTMDLDQHRSNIFLRQNRPILPTKHNPTGSSGTMSKNEIGNFVFIDGCVQTNTRDLDQHRPKKFHPNRPILPTKHSDG